MGTSQFFGSLFNRGSNLPVVNMTDIGKEVTFHLEIQSSHIIMKE